MNKSTFCPAPWHSLYLSSVGGWSPCCVSKLRSAGEASQVFHSSELNLLRKELSSGTPSLSCQTCWRKEAQSGNSLRTSYEKWIERDPKRSAESYGAEASLEDITYLDVSFSNTCNLKCRFCNPQRSSSWATEAEILVRGSDQEFWKKWIVHQAPLEMPKASELAELIEKLPNLKTININGGEPFAEKKHLDFLKLLEQKKLSSKIRLTYTTNGTLFPQEYQDLLPAFFEVEVMVSVEATGGLYQYIRGNHFRLEDQVLSNIHKMHQVSRGKVGFHTAVSVYSIGSVHRISEWIDCLPFSPMRWNLGLVAGPRCLSPYVLPVEYRVQVAQGLQDSPKDQLIQHREMLRMSAEDDYFRSGRGLEDFRRYTLSLDSQRNERLVDVAPDLARFL